MNTSSMRAYQFLIKCAMYFIPFRTPKMISGDEAVTEIPKILEEEKVKAVMVVTDNGITSRGLDQGIVELLVQSGHPYVIYDKTVANPTIANVEEGVELYKKFFCNAIIAIGGGSPMDCAKGIAARIACPKKTITKMRGLLKVGRKTPPIIAIPTTSGTGSETTLAAVLTDEKTHEKYAINDYHLIPKYAVLDPELTLSLSPSLTATTGMDALTHAVEAYIGNCNTKKTRKNAEEAVKLIFENLDPAYKNGNDLEARQNMQIAAYKAGLAFTRAYVGNVHAIAHTLGGQYNVPHGFANAVLLPVVLEYYGEAIYKKIFRLCKNAGILLDFKTPKERTEAFIGVIKTMNRQFNIPTAIAQLKIIDIPMLVERAFKESNPLYPVPAIFDYTDFENIYHKIHQK